MIHNSVVRYIICFCLLLGTSIEFLNISDHLVSNDSTSQIEADSGSKVETLKEHQDCTDCGSSDHCRHHCNGLHYVTLTNQSLNLLDQTKSLSYFNSNLKIQTPFLKCPGQPPNIYNQII